jgi:hypothetical protein
MLRRKALLVCIVLSDCNEVATSQCNTALERLYLGDEARRWVWMVRSTELTLGSVWER